MLNRSFLFFIAGVCLTSSLAFAGEAKRPSGPVSRPGKPGGILCEYFKEIDGNNVDDLIRNPNFPNKPTESILLNLFEIPSDSDDRYGTAVRGYLFPPTTGNYTFWIASDDGSELWLSPSDNPADKIKICQNRNVSNPRGWDQNAEQKSRPIPLTAGRTYYIEALHKEGSGGDHLAVGWQLPDGKMERPIPGTRLAPALPAKPPPPVTVAIQGTLPSTPGFHKCMAKIGGGVPAFDFPFLLFVPNDFLKVPVPSLLFLHGVGECGTDLEGVYGNGPHGHLRNDKKLRDRFPFLCIGPQCNPGRSWNQRPTTRATVALLDEILKQYGQYVDKERTYMTGLSMGGEGTWRVALEAPDRFAAIVPSDPRAVTPEYAAERLKELPIWIIAGAQDGDFTNGANQMFDALKTNVPKPTLILVPNCGHGAWGYYYPKWEFYQWFLKWTRSPARSAASAALAAAEKRLLNEPLPKIVPPVVPVTPPPPKVADVAKPVVPPPPPVTKPVAPPPVEVAKDIPPTPKPAPEVAKLVEAPKPAPEPAKIVESPKPAPVAPVTPPSAVAATQPPAKVTQPPVVVPPPKSAPIVVAEINPKAPLPVVSEKAVVAAKPVRLVSEPEEVDEKPAAPAHFPYAPVFLLVSVLLFGTATYFLATNDDE